MTCKDCIHHDVCAYEGVTIVNNMMADRVQNACGLFAKAIDFERIIRCEKCKHYDNEQKSCANPSALSVVDETTFCCYAEVK